MRVIVIYKHHQNYYKNKRQVEETIIRTLMNPKCDVLLIETPVKKKVYWTDIFIKNPEIVRKVKYELENKGMEVMALIADDFLGWHAERLVSFSTLARAHKIKRILEQV